MVLLHKRNATEAARRLARLYSGRMGDEICARLSVPMSDPALPPEEEEIREREPACVAELPGLLESRRRWVRHNYENPDDSLPCEIPAFHFEGGIETAMLGGEVRWTGARLHTYGVPVRPLIRDYAEFDWRLPAEDHPWLQRYLEAHRYMLAHAGDDFTLAFQSGMLGLNLPVQLRGAQTAYLDLHTEPESLRRLLDWTFDLHVYLWGLVEEIVGAHNARVCADPALGGCRVDYQPRSSVDAYSLCRAGTLRDWGAEQLGRFNALVGGTLLHIHENSWQVIEEVAEIPGWSAVGFSDAVGWPRGFDHRWELRRRMKDLPLWFGCEKEELLAGLAAHDLPGNTQYCLEVDSFDEARWIMDQVREYRAGGGAEVGGSGRNGPL
jgi:hypothetical protein